MFLFNITDKYFSLVLLNDSTLHVLLFQVRKRKLGLLEEEGIANLASTASEQASKFAKKDAAKENAPLEVAKSHGKFLISYW
jgi:hypothetical protein